MLGQNSHKRTQVYTPKFIRYQGLIPSFNLVWLILNKQEIAKPRASAFSLPPYTSCLKPIPHSLENLKEFFGWLFE